MAVVLLDGWLAELSTLSADTSFYFLALLRIVLASPLLLPPDGLLSFLECEIESCTMTANNICRNLAGGGEKGHPRPPGAEID